MFIIPVSRSHVSARQRASLTTQFGRGAERLFDDSLAHALGRPAPGADDPRSPAMDVSETETHYIVAFEVPGATRDQLKVSADGRRVELTTSAPSPAAAAAPGTEAPQTATVAGPSRVLYRERGAARYARTVSLPAEVDQASSQAKFDNGVLTLMLPKKVPAAAAQIAIS